MLSVLMPVYNAAPTVERAISELLTAEVGVGLKPIVVDDGSTDRTSELHHEKPWPDRVRLLLHDRNRGKGAAVRTGLAKARGEFTTIFDADLEYDPSDIAKLLRPL